MSYRFRLAKESFKFSCTHFTIFGPDSAERMHGHNYLVSFEFTCEDIRGDLGLAFDFNEFKPLMKKACDDLDEAVLIPLQSPYLKIKQADNEVEVLFSRKRYVLPKEDVRLLPIVNISIEALASYMHGRLKAQLKPEWKIVSLAVGIQETAGQGVSFEAP
jgi:6-pyruvoyltetrahydropterin/6-carboxytetrahydropterin synthase